MNFESYIHYRATFEDTFEDKFEDTLINISLLEYFI